MIRLLHLYPDLMNLYGDYGNIAMLERALRLAGYETEIIKCSVFDSPDFDAADFIFIGSGTERAQKRALEHLMTYRDGFVKAHDDYKTILLTGNAMEIIGKRILSADGVQTEALGIAEFETVETKQRFVRDVIVSGEVEEKTVGFINKCTEIKGVDKPLFKVEYGIGNCTGSDGEGWHDKNLYATHIIAPLLVRNPAMLYAVACTLTSNYDGIKRELIVDEYAQAAHDVALSELTKRAETGE